MRNVTLSDNNTTITLRTRERFLLDLGDGPAWQTRADDTSIVRRVPNISVARGQGVFEALAPGRTVLHATTAANSFAVELVVTPT